MARPGLTASRKFRRLSLTLSSPALARGVLELLWDACYATADDRVGRSEDVEYLVTWTGTPGALTGALVEAGFLDLDQPAAGGSCEYRIHDLWDHAPEYVLRRRDRGVTRRDSERDTQLARARQQQRRQRLSATSSTSDTGGTATDIIPSLSAKKPLSVPVSVPVSVPEQERTKDAREPRDRSPWDAHRPRPRPDQSHAPPGVVSDAVAEAAGRFLDRYPAVYAEVQHGAHYAVRPGRDYGPACALVTGWPDPARLEAMLRAFLVHPERLKPGTPAQFLALAPEIDAQIRGPSPADAERDRVLAMADRLSRIGREGGA